MTSSVPSNIPKSSCMKKYTNFKTLNPQPTKTLHNFGTCVQKRDQTSLKVSPQSSREASCSDNQLMELKDQFMSHVERIRSFVKHIKARELELYNIEDVEKRTMQVTPVEETNCSETMKINSTETRKLEATMMRKCGVILDKLMKHKHGWVFNKPVDVVALRIPDYYEVVKCPMDLGTVRFKLGKSVYGTPLDFAKDVRLTFDNAMLYNMDGDEVHTMATVLLDMFNELFDQAYEKYEVERQRVMVEQRKFGKPVAELTKDVAEEALCDAVPVVKTLDRKSCKQAAKKSVLKKQRTVPEVKEKPGMSREMNDGERDQLGLVLKDLVGEYLDEILQIVAKRNSKMITPDGDGEIELDIYALDNETLWDLHRFVRLNSKAEKTDKSPVAIEEDIDIGDEMPIIDYLPLGIPRDDSSSSVSKVRSSNSCSFFLLCSFLLVYHVFVKADSDHSLGSDSEDCVPDVT